MPRRFTRIGKAFEAIGHAVEPARPHSDPAMNWLHRSSNLAISLAAIVGIALPIAVFQPILIVVIALALATIALAGFAKAARTAPAMLLRTFLALVLLAGTMTLFALTTS